MTWIQTHTRRRFHLLEPDVEDVDIEDIAHALSHTCRFGGHTKQFYSVAQHSVLVSEHLEYRFHNASLSWEGLLHDAAEAYIGDLTRPQKHALNELTAGGWSRLEDRICEVVAAAFLMRWPMVPQVQFSDDTLLHTETRDLLDGPVESHDWTHGLPEPLETPVRPWPAPVAKAVFLDRYASLRGLLVLRGTQSKAHLAGADAELKTPTSPKRESTT